MTVANDKWISTPTLSGEHVKLFPLHVDDEPLLRLAVQDGELWKLWFSRVPSPDQMAEEIQRRLELLRRGTMMPFTVRNSSGEVVGMTTYQFLDSTNRRVEIGHTWYAKGVQRTALNTEAKFLLLEYAFDVLNCISVGFTTSTFNRDSRRAIERLGAKLDGVLRNHSLVDEGIPRDTCYYSIIQSEWPAVRRNLRWRLDNQRSGS
jgi:RimJ/RimL family protein N-acetyltransferase